MLTIQVLLVVFIMALMVTASGFRNTIWFVTIGYTFAILAMALALGISFYKRFTWFNWIQVSGLALWGIRLGAYILQRDKNRDYQNNVQDQVQAAQKLPLFAKFFMWIAVSFLFTCLFSPAIFSLQDTISLKLSGSPYIILGCLLLLLGIYIESRADWEKSRFKAYQPGTFVDVGLFRWVRYPNYLGELMVWTGNYLLSIQFYQATWQWAIATTGLIGIWIIMIDATRRLEKRHWSKYRDVPGYKTYAEKVPILFPYLPFFSFIKRKL